MQFRSLGSSGVQVSVVGVGCNRIGRTVDLEGTRAIVAAALDAGINFFDTADIYGSEPGASETLLGQALAGMWDRMVLATKVGMKMGDGVNERGASRYHIRAGIEESLRRLRTDHIDLYYIHQYDERTPIEETLRALDELVQSGKVRYVGASNFAAWQLARANTLAELRGWDAFVVTQEEYNLLQRDVEREIVGYCRVAGVGIIPYFPLAGGLLTGKYRGGQALSPTRRPYIEPLSTPENLARVQRLAEYAEARGHTPAELAVGWLLSEPLVSSVISGATNAHQVAQNAAASDWILTTDEAREVRALL